MANSSRLKSTGRSRSSRSSDGRLTGFARGLPKGEGPDGVVEEFVELSFEDCCMVPCWVVSMLIGCDAERKFVVVVVDIPVVEVVTPGNRFNVCLPEVDGIGRTAEFVAMLLFGMCIVITW